MRIGDYFLHSDSDNMAAINFYVYLASGSVYIQMMEIELELRMLSEKDIREGREVTAYDERKEGLSCMCIILAVTLIPSGFKAMIIPTKNGGGITCEDQTSAWSLLGMDEQFQSSDMIQVSINIGARELVLEYPIALILYILESPAQIVHTSDTPTAISSFFPLLDDLSRNFQYISISNDPWNFRGVDAWLRETVDECGKSERIIVKYEGRQGKEGLRKGSVAKKTEKAKSPPPPKSRRYRYV